MPETLLFLALLFLLIIVLFVYRIDENKKIEENARKIYENQTKAEQIVDNIEEKYNAAMDIVNTYIPGIVCWGDSLTAGAGGDGVKYPDVLKNRINQSILADCDFSLLLDKEHEYMKYMHTWKYSLEIPVLNMGVGGEKTPTILGRNGAIPFVLADSIVIPSDKTAVEINIVSQSGAEVAPLIQGSAGVNHVEIEGIEGTLIIEKESDISGESKYYFVRKNTGEAKEIEKGTIIFTDASDKYLDYITVIFIGQNGGYSSIDELISQQRAILNHQTRNNDRFIIVGLHTGTAENRYELEQAMISEYGSKYINLREYMVTYGLQCAGIEANETDRQMLAEGMTPASLLSDTVHFNKVGYELIGNLIFDRMDSLGYFDEIKEYTQSYRD